MLERNPSRTRSLMHVVETAYEHTPSLHSWIEAVTSAVSDTVGGRVAAVVGRVLDSETGSTHCPYAIRCASSELAAALRNHRDGGRVDILAGGPGLRHMTRDAVGRDARFEAMIAGFGRFGIAEMSHVTVSDGSLVCSVGIFHGGPTLRGAAKAWGQVAIHLRAALRLQRRRADMLRSLPDDAALFDPSGRVVEALGVAKLAPVRESLREAVRRIDRARDDGRGGASHRALEVWQGLVDGTWSVVDRHDSDGRRFIVAIPNELGARHTEHLTSHEAQVAALACEGYSDKWIGYTLGLARSTVATHLKAAMRKLDISTRVALTRTFTSGRPLRSAGVDEEGA